MNFYRNLREVLAPAGIDMLTREACDFSLRMLCDVNGRGHDLLCAFLDIDELPMDSGRNDPESGSVMLSMGMLWELALFHLALNNEAVMLTSNEWFYASDWAEIDEQRSRLRQSGIEIRRVVSSKSRDRRLSGAKQ